VELFDLRDLRQTINFHIKSSSIEIFIEIHKNQ